MERRIFQNPPPNVDESWTQGAMLGGMIGYGRRELADSYFMAGETLIVAVLEDKEEARSVINPILFLYRQSIELYLKCIVKVSTRTHSLSALLEGFITHVSATYNEAVPRWITEPVSEFAKFDPVSDVFRYADGANEILQSQGEFWIDLRSLRVCMRQLRIGLTRVIVAEETGRIPPPLVGV